MRLVSPWRILSSETGGGRGRQSCEVKHQDSLWAVMSLQTSHPGCSYPLASQDHLHLTGTHNGPKGWLTPFPKQVCCTLCPYLLQDQKKNFKKKKKLSDQALLIRQPKKPGLELISPWIVKTNFVQGVLTFLRIIKDQVVTFHKGPATEWMVSLVFPNA